MSYILTHPKNPPKGTILVLPGVNSAPYLFEGMQPTLGRDWRLMLLNPPGVGGAPFKMPFSVKTYAEYAIAQLEDAAISGPLAVLGHSLGSYTAQEVARMLQATPHNPAHLRWLILVSSSMGQPYTAQDITRLQFKLGRSFWQTMKDVKADPAKGQRFLFGSWPDRAPAPYAAFIAARQRMLPSDAVSLAQLNAGGMFSSLGWARKIAVPTLCIHGADDLLISAASGKALADRIPHARWLEYHDTGHFPMLEHPGFYTHIQQFLTETVTGKTPEPAKSWFQRLRETFFHN